MLGRTWLLLFFVCCHMLPPHPAATLEVSFDLHSFSQTDLRATRPPGTHAIARKVSGQVVLTARWQIFPVELGWCRGFEPTVVLSPALWNNWTSIWDRNGSWSVLIAILAVAPCCIIPYQSISYISDYEIHYGKRAGHLYYYDIVCSAQHWAPPISVQTLSKQFQNDIVEISWVTGFWRILCRLRPLR